MSRDTKQLAAYSSVCHINLVIRGVMMVSPGIFTRSYMVSLSHGYISTLIFFIIGEISHGRGTRVVYFTCGVSRVSSLLAVTYCLTLLANTGIPPYLSFWGELMLLTRMLSVESLMIVFLFGYFILALYYNFFVLTRLIKGRTKMYRVTGLAVMISGLLPTLSVLFFLF